MRKYIWIVNTDVVLENMSAVAASSMKSFADETGSFPKILCMLIISAVVNQLF